MARIDFRQVTAPSFADSNELIKLANQSGTDAIKGLQGVFKDALGAVQNRNHADMQTIINQQTPETLNDPIAVAALMQQFNDIAAPTGNNWDPTVVGAALDARKDTLLTRGGKQVGNAQAGVDLQSSTQDMLQTGIVNERENETAEAAAATAADQARNSKVLELMAYDKQYRDTFDLETPEGIAAAKQHEAELSQALAQLYPDGPMSVQDKAAQFALGNKQNVTETKQDLEIKAAEQRIRNANDQNNRANAALAWKMQEGERNQNKKQIKDVRELASLNNLPPSLFKEDGGFNAALANQTLAMRTDEAVRKLRNPENPTPFADRVSSYIKEGGEDSVLNPNQIRQAQKALTNYALQNVEGKSLRLTEDERWAVFQAMATGELVSDTAGTVNVAGFSNYEGLYEKAVPAFVNRMRQQTQPVAENNAIAAVYADFFEGLGNVTDPVAVREAMGIGPKDPRNKYMPPSIRHPNYTGGTYTDVPAYVDKALETKRAARNIEKSAPKQRPSQVRQPTRPTERELRSIRSLD